MSRFYVMREMPDIRKTGETVTYPSFVDMLQVGTSSLAANIARRSSFTEGDVWGIIRLIADEMAKELAAGNTVKLDGIGIFAPSLRMREGVAREQTGDDAVHRNAQSIMVGRICYRNDSGLLGNVNRQCSPMRDSGRYRRSSTKYSEEERLALALDYLKANPYINVRKYMELTGLLVTAATRELRRWSETPGSGIAASGIGSHKVYVSACDIPNTVSRHNDNG